MTTALALAAATTSALGSERVVLVTPDDPDAYEEIIHQVAGELRAAGFSVIVRTRPREPDRRELEALARDTECFAALALWGPDDTLDVEVWVVDLVTGKTVLRQLDGQPGTGQRPAILALRAVELLQASLLELDTRQPAEGEVRPSPPVRRFARQGRPRTVEPLPDSPRVSWSLLVGASIAGGSGGLPPVLAPSAGLAWHPSSSWSGQLWGTGPSLATLEDREGSATLDQELLALRIVHTWSDPEAPVAGFVVAGVGAYRLGAQGAAAPPYESTSAELWSGAALLGPGLTLRMSEGLRFFAEADAVWLLPRPEVRFAGRAVAFGGQPWIVGTLGVDVRW